MKMEEIERLEEAARKYSGVDKIRLAFFEGGKFMESQPNPVIEKLKELRDEYAVKKNRIIDQLPCSQLNVTLRDYVTIIEQINAIINEKL